MHLSMCPLAQRLLEIGCPRILVFGDLILDRYVFGAAERISPEAPVPVLRVDRREVRLGGAASVAALAHGLGAEVSLIGAIGDDPEGFTLRRLLQEQGIRDDAVLELRNRPTTTKERFIGRPASRAQGSGSQMLRVDDEICTSYPAEFVRQMHDLAEIQLSRCDVLLISDYAKGICSPALVRSVIDAAATRGVPVIVDPGRGVDPANYAGASVLVPNRVEAESVLGWKIESQSDALAAGAELVRIFHPGAVVLKVDRDGMFLFHGESPVHLEARVRDVCDVTGAGDMVLSVLGVCLGSQLSLSDATRIANVAAGIEVTRLGVAGVTRDEICTGLNGEAPNSAERLTLAQMELLADEYRRQGKTIVFTNGCFDLLHVGHVRYLQEAAGLGDILIVAINADNSVRKLKGPGRPVIAEQDRAAMLAALRCVAHVIVFDQDTPHLLLERIRPDVLVKGGTYRPDEVVGREVVEAYGGTVRTVGYTAGISTTQIVRTVHSLTAPADQEDPVPVADQSRNSPQAESS